MPKTNWQDPKSSEIISPHISGLQEAIGKLEESLGISSTSGIGIALTEVYISDSDRYRIYQAPEGNRNWLSSPTPIIKKNGVQITTGFIIEYGGGAIVFTTPLLSSDVITADATYTVKETTDIKTQINYLDAQAENLAIESSKTKWVSHRGYFALAPENSMPAYELAVKRGYYALEADICRTLDGYFVLMHDETVDRTTNGTGNVSTLTLAAIKALNIDTGTNIGNYLNLKVPTLDEFLKFCRINGAIPLLDLRLNSTYNNDLLSIIRKYDMENKCIIINSDLSSLQSIRALSSTIKLQGLFNFTSENIDICAQYRLAIDVPYAQVTAELIEEAHLKGVKVNTWTVSNYSLADNLINMGIDFITVDSIFPTGRPEIKKELKSFGIVTSIATSTEVILNIVDSETDFTSVLSNKITVKKSGNYLLIVKFSLEPNASDVLGSIFKNNASLEGLAFKNVTNTFTSWNKVILIRTETLNVGDALDLRIKHNAGTNLNSQWSSLELVLLDEIL